MHDDTMIETLEDRVERLEREARESRRRSRNRALFLALGVAGLGVVWAVSAEAVPNTFTAGPSISAQEMNDNFVDIEGRLVTRGTVYRQVQTVQLTPNTSGPVTVACAGVEDVLLSGSCSGMDPATRVYRAIPSVADTAQPASFTCNFSHQNGAETVPRDITAYALCLDLPTP